jgi:type VI secretion system secreted protein Hcp
MAAFNAFLKLGDIRGESTDAKHKDEIDVLHWSWGAQNPAPATGGGGGAAGRVTFADLSFSHRLDRASPALWRACAIGQRFRDATLSNARIGKGAQDYFTIKMTDVQVTSVNLGGASGDFPPQESVSLQFGRFEIEYKPQRPDGSLDSGVTFKFDVRQNKEF